MGFTKSCIAVSLGIIIFAASTANADDDPAIVKLRIGNGNPVDGKAKAEQCMHCHDGNGNASTSNIPKLAGQYADYIQRQIYNYQEGTRRDPDMTKISATLTNRRILADIAAYFASLNQMTGTSASNEEGKKIYLDKGCQNCHGEIGKGKPAYNSLFPIVGGQNKEYLLRQMQDFKTGTRTTDISGIMGLIVNRMTNDDIEAVSDYLSGM